MAGPDDFDPDTVAELVQRAKVALRKRARALRAAIPPSGIAERSARIVARLQEEPAVTAARQVALFWPIEGKHEVDLRALDAWLRARGVDVAYPRIDAPGEPLSFRIVTSEAELEPGPLGTREPPASAPLAAALGVVVVPCLLVGESGHRLGYGGGYYDRSLPGVCPPAISIAVAFQFQLAPEVPTSPGDVPVDRVVSDGRAFAAQR